MSDDEFGPRDLIPAHVRPLDVDEFDADGDGQLDMDEQRRMLGSLPDEEARLVRMELYQADKDGDGTVDMEEMRDFLAARRETRRRCCLSCVATLALVFLTFSVADTPKDYLAQRAVAAEGIPGLDPNNLECSDPCAYPHVRALFPRPPRALPSPWVCLSRPPARTVVDSQHQLDTPHYLPSTETLRCARTLSRASERTLNWRICVRVRACVSRTANVMRLTGSSLAAPPAQTGWTAIHVHRRKTVRMQS
eukprot:COSAG06_NODE_111_length_23480_cov_56.592703_3_plen_250_part_00